MSMFLMTMRMKEKINVEQQFSRAKKQIMSFHFEFDNCDFDIQRTLTFLNKGLSLSNQSQF